MAQSDGVAAPGNAAGPLENVKDAARGASGQPELAMSYCPRCSARLASRSCKLICPDCGYYMSCSDFH
ncbi:MAG: hypothetical protein ABSG27_07395 [Candidatus Acidiferrales bacterium]